MLDAALIIPGMTITASEMGRRGMRSRLKKMSADDRKALASKAGKARWDGMSEEEQKEFIQKLQAARKKKRAKKRKGKP
jgi:hypothetical protein